jgi:hypothetical protein
MVLGCWSSPASVLVVVSTSSHMWRCSFLEIDEFGPAKPAGTQARCTRATPVGAAWVANSVASVM